MKKMLCVARVLLALIPFVTTSPVAQAVATWNRVFLSSNGNDANNCSSQLTPCLTFIGAQAQTNVGGEIIVMTTGAYGQLTIMQSVTISAATGVVAFSGFPVTVNAPGATVVLRGLTLDGSSGDGIDGYGFATLSIENCVVNGSAISGINVSSSGKLFILDTIVRGTGNDAVSVDPTSGTITVVVERCRFENTAGGSGFSITGAGSASLREVVAGGNFAGGFYNFGLGGTGPFMTLENCTATGNGTSGVISFGAGAMTWVSNSVVTGNGTLGPGYVGLYANLGGVLLSRGNNTVTNNSGGPSSGTGTFSGN
jgi:hypothetical protein